MNITSTCVDQITTDIWTSILGFEIRHINEGVRIPEEGHFLTGCVQITGDWEGSVTLCCPNALARHATSVMFEVSIDEVSKEEIQDAIGELTNMIAGNIKSLLPSNCCLSLPSVTEGTDYKLTVPGSVVVVSDGFECDGFPLTVTVLERE